MKFTFTERFKNWINSNSKPATSQEQSALLDESRGAWLDVIERVKSGEIKAVTGTESLQQRVADNSAQLRENAPIRTPGGGMVWPRTTTGAVFTDRDRAAANLKAKSNKPQEPSKPAPAPTAAAKPAPSPYPAPAPKQAKPTAPAPAKPGEKFLTADEFLSSRPITVMKVAEFRKLSPHEKNEYMRSGGKLRD
jgi:hypothetical protein